MRIVFIMIRAPSSSTPFPYTTLFRSTIALALPLLVLGARMQDRTASRLLIVAGTAGLATLRPEEHTSELQPPDHPVCRLLLEKKNQNRPTGRASQRTGNSMQRFPLRD